MVVVTELRPCCSAPMGPSKAVGPRVLIVDDAPGIRRLVDLVLSKAGFSVTEAESGCDGLAQLAEGDLPDVVLLDVQVPDIGGWETITRIRIDARTAQLPVVMFTAEGDPEDLLLGWSLGCDGYLLKPVDITAMAYELRQVIARRPIQRDAVRRARVAYLRMMNSTSGNELL